MPLRSYGGIDPVCHLSHYPKDFFQLDLVKLLGKADLLYD